MVKSEKKIINYNPAGFTLIELLMVIAIIGILSSIVLVNLSGARLRAKDARRVTQLKSVTDLLEMYNLDYGKYPGDCWTWYWICDDNYNGWDVSGNCQSSRKPDLQQYDQNVCNYAGPDYPGVLLDRYAYVVSCDGTQYKLGAMFETAQYQKNTLTSFADSPGSAPWPGLYEFKVN